MSVEALPIRIGHDVLAAIRAQAARAYPFEGCGALLGPEPVRVVEAIPIPNVEGGSPRTRFTVSAADYIAAEERAEARGLRLLGFWHSHPDHPARPSVTDRAFAWEGLLTLVIAVRGGEAAELTAWDLPGPEAPFRERRLLVETEATAEHAGA